MIDTGAARSVLSFKVYNSFPASVKFSLSAENSAIALANSQQAKTYGVGHVVVRLGNSGFQMHVIVAEIEMGAFSVWTPCHKLIHVLTL